MERSWFTRVGVIVLVTLGSIWFLVPTYYSFFRLDRADRNNVKKLEEVLPPWAPPAKYRLSLGLDLQGGIHMVMRVDTKTALMKRCVGVSTPSKTGVTWLTARYSATISSPSP